MDRCHPPYQCSISASAHSVYSADEICPIRGQPPASSTELRARARAQLANANPHFAAQASLSGVLAWRRRAAAPIAEGLSQLKLVRAADARVRRPRSKGWGVSRRRAGGCPQRRDEQLAVPQVVNGRWVVKHRAAQALAVPCVQARAKLCSKPFLKLRCRSCTIEQSGTLRERHP
jgi:hypothetical protein